MSLDQGGEVTAEDFLYSAEVWLAVTGNQFRALLVYIESTIWSQMWRERGKDNIYQYEGRDNG